MKIYDIYNNFIFEVPGDSLVGVDLSGMDLTGANLSETALRWANLSGANLTWANLTRAHLTGADLTRANLSVADLRCARLSVANLTGANLSGTTLHCATLSGANLTGADLSEADLHGANLENAKLPDYKRTPDTGEFTAWKKVTDIYRNRIVLELRVPKDAQRTSSLVSKKCRADKALVVRAVNSGDTVFYSVHDSKFEYHVGEIVVEENYNPDIRLDCTSGIHFFMTREEAENYKN